MSTLAGSAMEVGATIQRTLSETRIEPWGSRRVVGVVGMGFPSFLKLLPALVAGHVSLSWIFWIYYPGYFG